MSSKPVNEIQPPVLSSQEERTTSKPWMAVAVLTGIVAAGLLTASGLSGFKILSHWTGQQAFDQTSAWTGFLGGGISMAVASTALFVFLLRERKEGDKNSNSLKEISWAPDAEKKVTYKVISWNVGSNTDYVNLNKTQLSTWDNREEISLQRRQDLKQAFENKALQNPDVICFQEVYADEFSKATLLELFPGYEVFTDLTGKRQDCAIVWNAAKFTKITEEILRDTVTDTANDTPYVQLQDKQNGAILLVASAHPSGFNLSSPDDCAEEGNKVVLQMAQGLPSQNAHFTLLGLDANADFEHYPKRLQLLFENGYQWEESDVAATYNDRNLGPVKIDHIFTNFPEGYYVEYERIPTPSQLGITADHKSNPGDHSPVIMNVTFAKE